MYSDTFGISQCLWYRAWVRSVRPGFTDKWSPNVICIHPRALPIPENIYGAYMSLIMSSNRIQCYQCDSRGRYGSVPLLPGLSMWKWVLISLNILWRQLTAAQAQRPSSGGWNETLLDSENIPQGYAGKLKGTTAKCCLFCCITAGVKIDPERTWVWKGLYVSLHVLASMLQKLAENFRDAL